MEVLHLPWEDGFEMFIKCVEHEEEERLYQFWVAYYTNPFGGKERKSWEQFKKPSKTKVASQESTGNISGVDLARLGK